MPEVIPVSYTHLDVYKRQPLIMLLMALSAASDYALQNLGVVINSDMIRNIAETTPREAADLITVSYTHLDVYKRQELCRRLS